MRSPTAVEPVKPTLSTTRSPSAARRPSNVEAPSAWTSWSTPSGRPAAVKSSYIACAEAAAYSAGFHTTALPHRSAGTRYHDGTATGKLPAVITAATPTGVRNVNSCLSGISLGTVSPYSRRPSPRKKSQVSTISCTSPRASARGLPTSRVTSRASASELSDTMRPIEAMTWPRTGAGTAAHVGWAERAARHAVVKPFALASSTRATTSVRSAGFTESTVPPAPAVTPPATMDEMVRMGEILTSATS